MRKSISNKRGSTLSDVAREVGVSSATVSLVLNGGNSTSRVSEATRHRIQTAAHLLDYRPNAVARSLARQRTDIIGFYCGYGAIHADSPFLAAILRGLLEECNAQRKDLLLHNEFHLHTADSTYDQLANGKIDGLVLFSPPSDRLVELLAASFLPAIVIADSVPHLPSVVVDDIRGAHLLAEHLAGAGHRRIMYRFPLRSAVPSTSVRSRFEAFVEFADARGMTVTQTHEAEWVGDLSDEEIALLSALPGARPTAVVCFHDTSAYGLVARFRKMGLRVPEDLAVVGFNGADSEAGQFCKLTTVRADWREAGRAAISLLIDLMAGKEIVPETMLPVELVLGETT